MVSSKLSHCGQQVLLPYWNSYGFNLLKQETCAQLQTSFQYPFQLRYLPPLAAQLLQSYIPRGGLFDYAAFSDPS